MRLVDLHGIEASTAKFGNLQNFALSVVRAPWHMWPNSQPDCGNEESQYGGDGAHPQKVAVPVVQLCRLLLCQTLDRPLPGACCTSIRELS